MMAGPSGFGRVLICCVQLIFLAGYRSPICGLPTLHMKYPRKSIARGLRSRRQPVCGREWMECACYQELFRFYGRWLLADCGREGRTDLSSVLREIRRNNEVGL